MTFTRRRTDHRLHFRLFCWTIGAWAPFWFGVWAINTFGPRRRTTRRYYYR